MRTLVVGDTHGDTRFHEKVMKAARRSEAQTVVQLGDWDLLNRKQFRTPAIKWLNEDQDRQYFWLDGNHDDHDYIETVIIGDQGQDSPIAHYHDRMFYCPRGSTTMLGGSKVMFVGGAYSIDKDRRMPGVSWFHQEMLRPRDHDRALRNGEGVEIIFSHDCPNTTWFQTELDKGGYKIDRQSQANRDVLTDIVKKVGPRKVYHGHYHTSYVSEVATKNGTCSVEGLAANVRHNPHQYIGPIFGDNIIVLTT